MKFNYPSLILIIISLFSYSLKAQSVWINSERSEKTDDLLYAKVHPHAYEVFELNAEKLTQLLNNVPDRFETDKTGAFIEFPNSQGKITSYEVKEASNFESGLQEKYPEIRAYIGINPKNTTDYIRFSYSPQKGLSSMSFTVDSPTTFIESINIEDELYAVYDRKSGYTLNQNFECLTENSNNSEISENQIESRHSYDGKLRTYRVAIAATAEYTNYHGGTKADALAAMNETMTRVNGIFEKDFTIHINIITDNEEVIYLDPVTDPFTWDADDQSQFNQQIQNTINSTFNNSEYDFGHLFSTGNPQGHAGFIGCICVPGESASAWTRHSVPQGDAFDTNYVAHEMGHQFGANHIHITNGFEGHNNHVEPGSGSTVMSYAGISGDLDVQDSGDDYFNQINMLQVANHIRNEEGANCAAITEFDNQAPTVDAGNDYTIPMGTAFVLDAEGSDADEDQLTYCWEQKDRYLNYTNLKPTATEDKNPLFRSYKPRFNNKRYFPNIKSIFESDNEELGWEWEVIPVVARELNFAVTVRDNFSGFGQSKTDDMKITVSDEAGPFKVTTPSFEGTTWQPGSTKTIKWNVANTDASPINTDNVDIFLIAYNFNDELNIIPLLENTPNDGEQEVDIPNQIGYYEEARIMVKASDNIFFAIGNKDFVMAGDIGLEEFNLTNIKLYPNPATGSLFIEAEEKGNITIINILGSKVLTKSFEATRNEINISSLKPGIYLASLEINGKRRVEKIIIE
ncbi:reprolysin-like metallopeptidase [Aureivirga sp. CE67]|uniref:zinc-dependent metalloprotease n=1 Tax=Aureivirga sp. CE67 TaxID=1788983 RepID=UPI0018CBB395|nr:zinc-dependent metalloprotease family protein [Aureivirga sp. CE67]